MAFASPPTEKAEMMERAAVRGRSLWDDARSRLLRNRAAVASLVLLGVLTFLAFIGPLLWVHDSSFIYRDRVQIPPGWENLHLFGTDAQGRDLLARTLVGLRMSLMVGVVATAVSLVIGVLWGATAGFIGGRVDQLMMRIVDVLYSLPFIFFVILLVVFFGRSFVLIFIAIGLTEWLDMARIVRGQTLTIKRQEYVQAAEALGVSDAGIVRTHVIPNAIGPVVVFVTLLVPKAILLESLLSFLGLGVQEPLTSLGLLISEGAANMRGAAWLLIFPAITLTAILFALNFLGDGLRDALDPKDR